jgi:hypothetical protein
MTANTEQDGLIEFLLNGEPAPVMAATTEVEILRCWIDVMERESSKHCGVPASLAAPAFVLDHPPLQRDTVHSTIASAGVADQLGVTLAIVVQVDAGTAEALTLEPNFPLVPPLTHPLSR